MAGGAACDVIFSVEAITSIFAVVFTLYSVCLPEATSMLAAQVAARGSARRTGCGCGDRVAALDCMLHVESRSNNSWTLDVRHWFHCQLSWGILVVLSGVVLVGFNMRDQVESPSPEGGAQGRQDPLGDSGTLSKKWNVQRICIPRFQDLEEHDYVEGCETWSFTAWVLGARYVVSHAWVTSEHRDLDGVQLKSVVREITKCNGWKFWKFFRMGFLNRVSNVQCCIPRDGWVGGYLSALFAGPAPFWIQQSLDVREKWFGSPSMVRNTSIRATLAHPCYTHGMGGC